MLKETHFNSALTLRQWKMRSKSLAWTGSDDLSDRQRAAFLGRAVSSLDAFQYTLSQLPHFDSLLGIEEAAKVLALAIKEKKRILIVGDYDVDGATSTATMITGLRLLGADHVDFLIPNRFKTGYGLSNTLIPFVLERTPDVVITVDNGIASHEAADLLQAHKISLIITDHHLPGDVLPMAKAIVNPNQHNDGFPCKALAGVGVVFYLLCALRARLNKTAVDLRVLLPWVALGTIADCVPLDHTNRTLIHHGLKRMRMLNDASGLVALCECSGINVTRITCEDIAFAIAPRLNAAGRLDDMSWGVSCLLSTGSVARKKAQLLDQLNNERKAIQKNATEQAVNSLTSLFHSGDLPAALALYDPSWHEGVIGLIATKIKDRFHRPTFAFTKSDDGFLKGSGRSINGLHLHQLLQKLDQKNNNIIEQFGGHSMACGLKLREKHFNTFNAMLIEASRSEYDALAYVEQCEYDCILEESDLTLSFTRLLYDVTPWGQLFPIPTFLGHFTIKERFDMGGGRHIRLRVIMEGGFQVYTSVAFNIDQDAWNTYEAGQDICLVYQLKLNYYRGQESLQLYILDVIKHS